VIFFEQNIVTVIALLSPRPSNYVGGTSCMHAHYRDRCHLP